VIPKRVAPFRRFVRLLVSAATLVAGWAAWRTVKRSLTPVNPKLALRYGFELTRTRRRVLAVSAHQDDLELFAGGTLRLLGLAGSHITALIATGGDRQYNDVRTLDEIREQEQRDAGTILGYDDVRFLRYRDLELGHNPDLTPAIKAVWEEFKPDVVLAFDPTVPYRSATHTDHLAVGRAVLTISRAMGDESPMVLFYASRDPNVLVDISQVILDKSEAIRAHRSQLYGWKRFYVPVTRTQARIAGRPVGVQYAEPWRCLSLGSLGDVAYLETWPRREPQLH
jgi:LmbE family N-acetylglucosaminyl deacetylase